MAPTYLDVYTQFSLTNVYQSVSCRDYSVSNQYVSNQSDFVLKKQETKKERIARLAKEKMYASWKMFHEKEDNIKKIIQINKPIHRLNHSYKRF